jgi:transmembrane sensor
LAEVATLMATHPDGSRLTVVQREALDWLGRLHSGGATEEDFAAWEAWRNQSLAHAQAYDLAQKILRFTGEHEQKPDEALVPVPFYEREVPRRVALAAMVFAAGGYGFVNPPMGMWPSLAELSSDYRTQTGQQKQLALASGLSVELNTNTSVSLNNRPQLPGIKLVSGEVAVNADLPRPMQFVASTGEGEVKAQNASFDLRKTATGFRAICVTGLITVRQNKAEVSLQPGEAIVCTAGARAPGQPFKVDADAVTAWRKGEIVFRNASLREIVAEINRYRRGEIILINQDVGERKLSGSFSVKHLDDMADHLALFAGVHASTLPGGIILLG